MCAKGDALAKDRFRCCRGSDVGARVTIISSNKEKVDAAVKRLGSPDAKGVVANAREEEAFVQSLRSLGVVDHIVYSAVDNIIRGKLEDLDIDAAKHLFGVKLWGAIIVGKGEIVLRMGRLCINHIVFSCRKVRHYPEGRVADLDFWDCGHQTWKRSCWRFILEWRRPLADQIPGL